MTARLRADPASKETLIELANFAGASPRTLERIFRDETGMSFTEWRHRLRLVEALEKLSEGLAVNQVASAVGYDSTSAFINAFRSH
ncbi:helix-turn-helix transcriptional regulator, partial [Jeotgalicoccus huakuii]|nr:helix-turn-helix transcriptional regulator [Jeotgalicoccus huakuii]